LRQEDREAIARERSLVFEFETPIASGLRYLHTVKSVCRDGNGEIIGVMGIGRDITERKALEDALRTRERELSEAHRKLERVLNSISDGLVVLDKDWRYIYFNEQGARIVGMRPEELVGNCIWELFPHLKGTNVDECFHQAVKSGRPVRFERFLPGPPTQWLECQCYPSEAGLSVYFRDITERKSTEEALRVSESRFRKLFESDLLGICIPDKFGAFYEGNDEFLRIVGYTREDLDAGRVRWDIMTPPEYADLDALHIAEAAQRGSCTPYEKEYIRKDGTRVPIACGYTLLEGSQDKYLAFVEDLSRQKEAEAALREREERFRVLAESLPEFVWIRDRDGRYVYCNQRLLDYVGKPAEWLQTHAFEAVHPDDVDVTLENWNHSVETGEPYSNAYRLRRHDGVYRYFLARAVPMRNEAGRVERWLGSTTDIHDQKTSEEALRRAEKLNAVARLAANMSHEINNPLNSVVNSVYLALQDPSLKEETRRHLRVADRELARTAQVASQMLQFRDQSSSAAPADLSEIMDSVLSLFKSRMESHSIVVEREYLTHDRLHCFNDEMRHVFANLISNSVDAIKRSGKVRVRIAEGRSWRDPSQCGIRVTVADTGEGIPQEVQRKIFEPFVSTKEATGTGLGLWVAEGIVKKHKGKISIRSASDARRHGTVIMLFLPVAGMDK
jgi:PAS domain S-box-containing protein